MIGFLNNILISVFSSFLAIGLLVYIYRMFHVRARKRQEIRCRNYLLSQSPNPKEERRLFKSRWKLLLQVYSQLNQSIICQGDRKEAMGRLFTAYKIDIKLIKMLMKGRRYQRCYAANSMAYIPTDAAKRALIVALEKESSEVVRLYILHAITTQDISAALPTLIDTLKGSSDRYRRQAAGFILNFRSAFLAFFPLLAQRKEHEVQELIIRIAEQAPSDTFLEYLKETLSNTEDPELRREAFRCLVNTYSHGIDPLQYLLHHDKVIVDEAIMGLSNYPSKRSIAILLRLLAIEKYSEIGQMSLSNLISRTPNFISETNRHYFKTDSPLVKSALVHVASERLEYFLPRIKDDKTGKTSHIAKEIIKAGYLSSLVGFLNSNRDREIENVILDIIREAIKEEKLDHRELQYYLNHRILKKMDLEKLPIPKKRTNEKNESVPLTGLYMIMIGAFLVLPVILGKQFYNLGDLSFWKEAVKLTMNKFLIGFGFYGLTLNGIYLTLFLLGFINSRKQDRYRNLKDTTMLFQNSILPSLSIIVPAYGEEATIIENVHSLLNLRYPDLEVIVINDGSPDDTLGVLIEHFQLRKEDRVWSKKLNTQPVRGIYINPNIPELTVIDKINGGKADTLNVGINFARNDYFVGIDSDSLLERDSLLEVMGLFLDEDKPVVAAGGNIMPINGCTVDRGVLEKKAVSLHPLAFLQTIEYLRSFMNGRMGWAELDALLIISGAFGVFKREEVLQVGGYLTSSGRYLKDTVGEDMELVVRLHDHMTQSCKPFSIRYVAAANCWTEVPVSMKILGRQRDRWQRGLLDILTFHKKMIFNPKYGGAGLLAFPYFLIFEAIGPWFELQATLLLILGLSLGWISSSVLIFTLIANFAISAFLSLCAMAIADWRGSQFSPGGRLLLAFAALAETLGFRQVMSFYRISGYINTLKKKTGWGKMTRKGFGKSNGAKT